MSTNKTEHFGLHKWELGDDFLTQEINENFAKLDGAVRVCYGSYVGDGTAERAFHIGVKPKVVIAKRAGNYYSFNDPAEIRHVPAITAQGVIYNRVGQGGIELGNTVKLLEDGFQVNNHGNVNAKDVDYMFVAFY